MMDNVVKYGKLAKQLQAQAQAPNPDNPQAMYLAATEKFYASKASATTKRKGEYY